MISRELAEKFIERVSAYTEYNVNIMDENGEIIASRDAERVGQYHEVAHRIIEGEADIVDTTDIRDFSNVLPGINMVIEVDGKREGVVGVTGVPSEIRPVALIVKMAIETMLKYERQQEQIRLRENKKERFIYFLTQVEHPDPAELRALADELGYPEEMARIPILIRTRDMDGGEVLRIVRKSPGHTRMDFSFVLSPHHILIFKTMPCETDAILSDYKYRIGEYLGPLLRRMREKDEEPRIYIGNFEDSYTRYYYAYQHCKWLERNGEGSGRAVFFYDYAGQYLKDIIPMREVDEIFHFFEKKISAERFAVYMEAVGALISENYNFAKASKKLFIHKNTLVYRYNQMKELLDVDPVTSASDRAFLAGLHLYARKRGLLE